MPSAPFGHSAIRPIIGQLSHPICNLSSGFVDKLPPLEVIPVRRQPQMPVQHPGNQRGRYQIVLHAAIVRPAKLFSSERTHYTAVKGEKIAKTNGPQRQSTPQIWPRHPDIRLFTSRSRRDPPPGPTWQSWVTTGFPSWLTHQLVLRCARCAPTRQKLRSRRGRRPLRNSLRGSYFRGFGRRLSAVSFTLRPCNDSASPNKHRAADPYDCRPVARAQSLCVAALKRRPESCGTQESSQA